jgi:hypothetical protein
LISFFFLISTLYPESSLSYANDPLTSNLEKIESVKKMNVD